MYERPPLKKKLLPKRVIAVFGPESSGTTSLTTVLGVATGIFPREGKWNQGKILHFCVGNINANNLPCHRMRDLNNKIESAN